MTGTLLEDNGCLYVESKLGAFLIIWPKSTRLIISDAGTPTIMSGDMQLASVGDVIEITGGISNAQTPVGLEARCPGETYLAAEVRSES